MLTDKRQAVDAAVADFNSATSKLQLLGLVFQASVMAGDFDAETQPVVLGVIEDLRDMHARFVLFNEMINIARESSGGLGGKLFVELFELGNTLDLDRHDLLGRARALLEKMKKTPC